MLRVTAATSVIPVLNSAKGSKDDKRIPNSFRLIASGGMLLGNSMGYRLLYKAQNKYRIDFENAVIPKKKSNKTIAFCKYGNEE